MKIIRNIIVALSMYSRIPMPRFVWKEEDTKYAIGFIGIVGVIIGGIEYLLLVLRNLYDLPDMVKALIWSVVPLIVTGGFHVDGFLDVKDAFNSYKPKEEKLKILKDPHIGAFAIISFAIYGCVYISAAYLVVISLDYSIIAIACIGFILSRGIGALLSVCLNHAKPEGMLHEETKRTNVVTKVIAIITIVLSLIGMGVFNILGVVYITTALIIFILWYVRKCNKEFGGISGDTIGYFITESELIIICIAAVLTLGIV